MLSQMSRFQTAAPFQNHWPPALKQRVVFKNGGFQDLARGRYFSASLRPTPTKIFWKAGPAGCQKLASRPCNIHGFPQFSFTDLRRWASSAGSAGADPTYTRPVGCNVYRRSSVYGVEGGNLPELEVAYETWGALNNEKTNAVLLFGGISASSHAASTEADPRRGWWEKFIGPGRALDTNKFFIISCCNLGSCFGSTGPSTKITGTATPYALEKFPEISMHDIVKTQLLVLDSLSISTVHAAVGGSFGGMLAFALAARHPHRVNRIASLSGGLRAHPTTIAWRYVQRRALMTDPNFNGGNYYGSEFPRAGMRLAREAATISYRSGREWDRRFALRKCEEFSHPAFPTEKTLTARPAAVAEAESCGHNGGDDACAPRIPQPPAQMEITEAQNSGTYARRRNNFLDPEFEVESYLSHQGAIWCDVFDPNSTVVLGKAADRFDLLNPKADQAPAAALANMSRIPTLIIGVVEDQLMPLELQREAAAALRRAGNPYVVFYELRSVYGHDTFLLDAVRIGAAVKGHLENDSYEASLEPEVIRPWTID